MNKEIVISVFYDREAEKVLSEKRSPDSPLYPNQVVFPSGTVEDIETSDFSRTLIREAQEEFGVVPTEFVNLDGDDPLKTSNGKYTLHLYLITGWKGKIPNEVLDKGNPLLWETLDEVASSEVENRRAIVDRIRTHIQTHQ